MPDLLYEKHQDEHYAVFTMNRPDRLNAVNGLMFQELRAGLTEIAEDDAIRVLVLTGAGLPRMQNLPTPS